MFFIYNINTLCFRTIDNEKRKNIYFYLFSFVVCLFSFFSPGVLETMAGVFARHNISVKSIVQRGRSGAERVDQVVVTHRCRERDIREALEEALALDNVVLDTPSVIRVEE